MGKNINKLSLSKSAVIGCLIAATAFTAFGLNTYEEKKVLGSNETQVLETKYEPEFLIDSQFKYYTNLDKVARIVGFDFKLPDYEVDNFDVNECTRGIRVRKINDLEYYATVFFSNKDYESETQDYTIDMFKGNPKDVYTKEYEDIDYSTIDITSAEKTIGNITGEDITIVQNYIDNKDEVETRKIFAWNDEGIHYAITYSDKFNSDSKSNIYTDVSEEDVAKIINSMKKPDELTNVQYFNESFLEKNRKLIYDAEDLDEASKELGFAPKFIKNLNDDLEIFYANLSKNIHDKLDIEMGYRDENPAYIIFSQCKDSQEYDEIKDNKYFLYKDDKNKRPIKSEKLTMNDKEVYKIKEKTYEDDETGIDEYTFIYVWEDNEVYYKVNTFGVDENYDNKLESIISNILK